MLARLQLQAELLHALGSMRRGVLGSAFNLDAQQMRDMKTLDGTIPGQSATTGRDVLWVNACAETHTVFWKSPERGEVQVGAVEAGQSLTIKSHIDHRFVARNAQGEARGAWTVQKNGANAFEIKPHNKHDEL